HDPKLDDPALLHFMRTPARYLGAVGSRKTNATRMERLLQKGATPEDLAKIHAPIGLDLGGRTPEEMALAIIAEIVAVRNGRSGGGGRAGRPGRPAGAQSALRRRPLDLPGGRRTRAGAADPGSRDPARRPAAPDARRHRRTRRALPRDPRAPGGTPLRRPAR